MNSSTRVQAVGQTGFPLSLCMIVRDNAATLEASLCSIKPWVDELVVVDTGSVDATPEIARRWGARLFHFAWCDDFSAAFNEPLKYACGQWIFRLDSDETIDEENGRKLRRLAEHGPDDVSAYLIQSVSFGPEQNGHQDRSAVDVIRLFRNLPEFRWEGRVHEQILPSILRAGRSAARSDILVWHSHYEDPNAPEEKLARDVPLFEKELAEDRDSAFVWFNLGMTYLAAGRIQEAETALCACIQRSETGAEFRARAFSLFAQCLCESGRTDDAWKACLTGLSENPNDPHLLFRKAAVARRRGCLEEAAETYLQILRGRGPWDCAMGLDLGIVGFKSRNNLAGVLAQLGRLRQAEEQYRIAIEQAPTYRPAWRGLLQVLSKQGRTPQVHAKIEQLLQDRNLRAEGLIQKSQMLIRSGDSVGALRALDSGLDEFPDDDDLKQARSRLQERIGPTHERSPNPSSGRGSSTSTVGTAEASETGGGDPLPWLRRGREHLSAARFQHAVEAICRSIELSTVGSVHLPSAYTALAEAYIRWGRDEAAWQACRKGLTHCPADVRLLYCKGRLAQRHGRVGDAETIYQQILAQGPTQDRTTSHLVAEVRRHVAEMRAEMVDQSE